MGKKDQDEAASFFGDDDLDWFDEEEEAKAAASLPPATPVAPPPPPPYRPPADALDATDDVGLPAPELAPEPVADPASSTWDEQISEAPLGAESSAPTLVFSSVPTLPPQPAPSPEEVAAAGMSPEDKEAESSVGISPIEDAFDVDPGARLEFVQEQDLPTLEVDPTSEEVPAPLRAEDDENDDDDDDDVSFVAFEDDSETPMVRTQDPSPVRVHTHNPDDEPAPVFTPPVELGSAGHVERWAPKGDEQSWREVATTLVAEAAVTGSGARGRLLYEAGLVYARLGDRYGAETLLNDAHSAGFRSPRLFAELADLARERKAWSEVHAALAQRGDLLTGTARAESWLDASVIQSQRLGQTPQAVDTLVDAAEADPQNYAVLSLLRDHYAELGKHRERAEVLGRIAAGSSGHLAAESLWEQGCVLAKLDQDTEAREAFKAALDASPAHGASFLTLELLLRNAEDWVALAGLYAREAARDDQLEPAWWDLEAARCWALAGRTKKARMHFRAAIDGGNTLARRELQAWLIRTEQHEDLAKELLTEAQGCEGLEAACAWYRLAVIRERRLEDDAGAIEAYEACAGADASAKPAIEAASRLRQRQGMDEVVAGWRARAQATSNSNEKAAWWLRVAEQLEAMGQQEGALEAYEAVLDLQPDDLLCVDGACRVLRRLERFPELSSVLEARAALVDGMIDKAHWLAAAAAVGPLQSFDQTRSLALYKQALQFVPHHPCLDDYLYLLEQAGDFQGLAKALERAATTETHPGARAAFAYRAARVHVAKTHNLSAARAALEVCLGVDAHHAPALQLRAELVSSGAPSPELYEHYRGLAREDANSRDWFLLAAALVASEVADLDANEVLGLILAQDPRHPGALALAESAALATSNDASLLTLLRNAAGGLPNLRKALRVARTASLAARHDRTDDAVRALQDLRGMDVPDRPLRAASLVARSVGHYGVAEALLEPCADLDSRRERGRLLARKLRDPERAREVWRELLTEVPYDLAAAHGLARVAQQLGEREDVIRANRILAEHAAPALTGAYALWSATLLEEDGSVDEAQQMFDRALQAQPGSRRAFDGAIRVRVGRADAEGVRAVFSAYRPDDRRCLAEALEAAGDITGATEVLRAAGEDDDVPLPLVLITEQLLASQDDWKGVYDVLQRRTELVVDEAVKSALLAKKRWVLAEKLADTDEAWELYQQLHDEAPDDREVTECLARIAGVRGETALAIQYLGALAEGALGDDGARLKRRIGEAYEAAGDLPSARQAFLDALDHKPDDFDALAGLKRLAEAEEDWPSLIGVIQRESGIAGPEHRIELLKEIALVTQTHLDPSVAMDAWRAVLDVKSRDADAINHLMDLAEAQGEWGTFVEQGKQLAVVTSGAERAALLRRIGIVCEEQLDEDDAIRFFEQAIAETPPDSIAAQRLTVLYRGRGDYQGLVRSFMLQANLAESPSDKVGFLENAASVEAETRHDKAAAAKIYTRILTLDPGHVPALRFQAAHLFESGRFDEALPVCRALEPHVEDGQDLDDFDVRMDLSSFYFYYGQILSLEAEGPDAIQRYERALELNPTHLATLEAVGPLYTEYGHWKKAERVYRQLLQLSGGQGDREKVANTYTALGRVERKLGVLDKAYKRFNRAQEIFPNHVPAMRGMALVLEDRKDWSNLLNVFNNIIHHATEAEDVIDAYMTKGRILDTQMNRPDKAAQHYERSLAFDAHQPVALLRLAELAMRRTDYMEAGSLAQRALNLEREPGVLRSELLLISGAARKFAADPNGADVAWREALQGNPALAELHGDDPFADLEALRELLQKRLP